MQIFFRAVIAHFPIFYLGLFCCASPPGATAQGVEVIDSLKNELPKLPEDSTKALLYDEICWQLLYVNPSEALKYADSTILLSEQVHFPKGIVKGTSNKAGCHYVMGDLEKALALHEKCDSLSTVFGYLRGRRAANSNIANILYQTGDFAKALERHTISLKWAVEDKDTVGVVKAYSNQSAAMMAMGDFQAAIETMLKALELMGQTAVDKWLYGIVHNNLCACFHEIHDFEKSVPHCRKAIQVLEETERFALLPTPLFNLGDAYSILGKRDSALAMLKKGFEYGPEDRTLYYGYAHLGSWYSLGDQLDSALHYMQLAYGFAKQTGLAPEAATAAFNVGKIYQKKGKEQLAYQYFSEGIKGLESLPGNQVQLTEGYRDYLLLKSKLGLRIPPEEMERYIEMRDSVFSEKKEALLNEIETKYETRLKQDSIGMLEIQNRLVVSELDRSENLKWLFATLATLFVCLSGALYYFFRLKKSESQRLARDMEILESANLDLKDSLSDKEKQLVSPAFLAQQPITLTNREKTVLQLGDILYIKAERGAVQVVTAGEKYWDWQLLKHYAAILPEGLFVQSHKSYLVNRLHVKELKATTLSLSNGNALNVGKTYRENLQAALLRPSENG